MRGSICLRPFLVWMKPKFLISSKHWNSLPALSTNTFIICSWIIIYGQGKQTIWHYPSAEHAGCVIRPLWKGVRVCDGGFRRPKSRAEPSMSELVKCICTHKKKKNRIHKLRFPQCETQQSRDPWSQALQFCFSSPPLAILPLCCLCQSRLLQLNQAHKDTQEHLFFHLLFFVLTPLVRGKTLLLLLIFLSSFFLLSTERVSAYSIKLKRWDRGCRPVSYTALFLASRPHRPLKSSFPCLLSRKTGSLADWWTASLYSVRCPFLLSCQFVRPLLMYNLLISTSLVNT